MLPLLAPAQDKLSFILIQGEASYTVQQSKTPVPLVRAVITTIPARATLKMNFGARGIAFDGKKALEIGGEKAMSLTTEGLASKIDKARESSTTSRFLEYMQKLYADKKDREVSAGTVGGAASRGSLLPDLNYSPEDETIIVSDSVRLHWRSGKLPFTGHLLVFRQESKDTLFNAPPPADSTLLLPLVKPGRYEWTYQLRQQSTIVQFNNTFLFPEPPKRMEILAQIIEFKLLMIDLSKEMSASLMRDYLKHHHYYVIQQDVTGD